MDVFLARQPIFDRNKKVYAYEILYRNSHKNAFDPIDADTASANVIINAFQTFGIESLTNKKPAFINFTENLINREVATIIPRDSLVIELLETVEASQDIIAMCQTLKQMGYTLALDDFIYKPEYEPLIALADIIKVDFLLSDRNEIEQLIRKVTNHNITLLAEKVETREEFEYAKGLGFKLFQGYFFSKPEILTTKSIEPLQANYLQVMSKINQAQLNFDELAQTISRDLSLVYHLLRLTNSAAFGFKRKVRSVKQALVMLGEKEIRKWLSLLMLRSLGRKKPDELVRLSLIRAKFAEAITANTPFKDIADKLFLAGLFSLLDVILDKPLEAILNDIEAADEVKDCLLNQNHDTGAIYKMMLSYEQGDWDDVIFHANALNLDRQSIFDAYMDSLVWYNEISFESLQNTAEQFSLQ